MKLVRLFQAVASLKVLNLTELNLESSVGGVASLTNAVIYRCRPEIKIYPFLLQVQVNRWLGKRSTTCNAKVHETSPLPLSLTCLRVRPVVTLTKRVLTSGQDH